jgi:tRNA-guanine family transglycosylase
MDRLIDHEPEHPEITFAYLTRENMLYNLTPFSQKRLHIPYVLLQASDLLPIEDVMAKLPPSLPAKDFLGFPNTPIYFAGLSPVETLSRGSNDLKAISIKSRQSYTTMNNAQFLQMAKQLDPEYLQTLSEEKNTDPRLQLGKKSDKRAIKKMLSFFDEAVALKKTGALIGCKLLIPVVDTEFAEIRKDMVKEILERADSLGGVVVRGLNSTAKEPVSGSHIASVLKDLEEIRDHGLMRHKVIGSSALGHPVDVLKKVNWGFNFFESAYPFVLAEEGRALNFWPEDWLDNYREYDGHLSSMKGNRLDDDLDIFNRNVPFLDLKNVDFMKHKDSIFPTHDGYPFKEYSKAYICHLLNNEEMTGNVLLTLHNCFIYQEFFKVINRREFRKNAAGLIYAFCRFICT